jgi:hypothetical protein
MKRTYAVLHIPDFNGDFDSLPPASIDCRPWEKGGPLPPAEARAAFDGSRFDVRLRAWERPLRVAAREPNGPVWEDSCVEFFVNFAPERDARYLNFEVNAEGVMLLGFGRAREGRRLLDFAPELFQIHADVPPYGAARWDKPFYTVRFSIPLTFVEEHYGKLDIRPGYRFAGNFQKCGEGTASPHYGCWNPIQTPEPDFHRPEHFGELVISAGL